MSFALERARTGDHVAFAALIEPYRRELRVHCYRMLGSVADADDLLQETMTAAWCGLDGFAGRSSLRAWLYRIATRRCLNAIRDAKRRPPPAPAPPFDSPDPARRGDVTWLQPYPDAWLTGYRTARSGRQSITLPANRSNSRSSPPCSGCHLGRPPPSCSATCSTSPPQKPPACSPNPTTVKGLLQRGRAALGRQQSHGERGVSQPGSRAEQTLAQRFADAFMADDVDQMVALLTDDAWLAMPPAPHEYHGLDAIAEFLRARAPWQAGRRFSLLATRVNNQPAFGCYLAGQPTGVLALTLRYDRIDTVRHFLDTRLPCLIGLPATYEAKLG